MAKTRITIDKAGRVVIPKPYRKILGLEAGDSLALEREGDKITLRPLHAQAGLVKELGVWVYRTGTPLDAAVTDEVLEQIRLGRDRESRNRE